MARALAALFLLWVPVQNALAWSEEGHRLVAEIAERHLNAGARAHILELLKDDRSADGTPSGRRTLGEIASWADEIKERDWGQRLATRHFDDVPLCGKAEYSKYCRNGHCASAYLARQLTTLADGMQTLRRRNQALKWVVHLVGDIHQPLHAANHNDRGGNNVEVSFFGERGAQSRLNLHAIWDFHLLRRLVSERGGESAIVSVPISSADKPAWERGSVSDWIAESHRIARDIVYPALPVAVSCSRRIAEVVAIDQAYYSKAAPIVETQIGKAGVRLARVLNETLGR